MSHAAPASHAHGYSEEFDAHGHKDHGHLIVSAWTLRAVFAALLFFTLLTSGAAVFEEWVSSAFHVMIPQWLNVAVALSIAVVKTALVVLFFMQLKYDNPLNSMIFIFTIITVAFFLGFTALDLGKRSTIDRFKGEFIYEGGKLDMGGVPLGDVEQRLKKVTEADNVHSIVDLARFDKQHGTGPFANKHDAHGHAHHGGHGPLEIITNAGFKRHQPGIGSSEERSRPIKGLTLPDFAPADQHAPANVHDPAAAPEQADKKPEAAPAKH